MGDKSKIEWTDATWNPITGCTPVSEGCRNCYAERMHERFRKGKPYSKPFSEVRFHHDRLNQPLRWKKPRRIFVCSMGDLFHEDVPMDWVIENVLPVIERNQRHTFMVLTKRPRRMRAVLEHHYRLDYEVLGKAIYPDNLWLGVSVEDQKTADERIPILLQTPAAIRFASVEPMLGPVDLNNLFRDGAKWSALHGACKGWWHWAGPIKAGKLDWVIIGEESGPRRRHAPKGAVDSLAADVKAAGLPLFVKQANTNGKLVKMPFINGRQWAEFPEGK